MKLAIKITIILAILLIILTGCSKVKDSPSGLINNTNATISGIKDLMFTLQELQQLGMSSDIAEEDIQLFGLNGTNCRTEDNANTINSAQGQYSICVYYILNDTQIIIELQKFTNFETLNGSYQYNSQHLFSVQGIISKNDYGDQSTFRLNNENDYGGQFNNPNVYYYHLWYTKDLYLVHITSKGNQEVEGNIAEIGRLILSKFE